MSAPDRDRVAVVMACVVLGVWVIVSLAGVFNFGNRADFAFNTIAGSAAAFLFSAPMIAKARKEARKWRRH